MTWPHIGDESNDHDARERDGGRASAITQARTASASWHAYGQPAITSERTNPGREQQRKAEPV